jgi:predicted AlkP superfamily phosphohydrolase/phosphomutase
MVIGLDGATWAVLDRYMADGQLPHLKGLVQRGARAVMSSTIPPITPVAWTTMTTGTNPGQHGILAFGGTERMVDGKMRFVPTNAAEVRQPTVWGLLSAAGRTVCVVNVPVTYPPVPVNGYLISGMYTPNSSVRHTYPESLRDELIKAGIDYQIDFDWSKDAAGRRSLDLHLQRISGNADWFFERAALVTRERLKAIKYLMKRPWDFFMGVFVGMDRVQHAFWDYLFADDLPNEPRAETINGRIRAYYAQLDEAVGEIVDQAGQETVICLVSDHGFCGAGRGDFFVNTWLHEHGWLSKTSRSLVRTLGLFGRRLGITRGKIGKVVGVGKASQLASRAAGVDWTRTRAYFPGAWAIRLNVVAGDLSGRESSSKESNRLRDRLAQELLEATDPEGRKVMRAVHRSEDLFRGPYAREVGDLILEPFDDCGYTFYSKELLAHGTPRATDQVQRGTHDLNGIFLLSGPDIKETSSVMSCSIMDMVPTVLHLVGEPIPGHIEGRVVQEMMIGERSDLPLKASAARTPAEAAAAASTFEYSEEDRAEVEARLRDLGYLD